MEAVCSTILSVHIYQTTWYHIEETNRNAHYHKILHLKNGVCFYKTALLINIG